MKRIFIVAAFVATMFSVQPVFAWDGWTHKLIAHIADPYLTPDAKATAEYYLGSSIMDHATWMDRVASWNKNRIRGWEQTSLWHMATVDRVGKNKYALSEKRTSKGSGDLQPQLERSMEILRNRANHTDSAVMINLKCVIHMVQDMHCPAHIYYTEDEDCFGLRVDGKKVSARNQMRVYYEGKKTTFHKVWDGMSIRELYPDYEKDFDKFRATLDNVKPKKRAKICQGTTEDWLLRTAKDCRYIYEEIERGGRIDYDYILDHKKLSKHQCLCAAYRLAHILNECLK